MNPWNVKEDQFKTKKTLQDQIKFLLNYAVLAPSGYNSQPWKFRLDDNHLIIFPDLKKSRPVSDPKNRELFISLGALVQNLIIAASHFGLSVKQSISKDKIELSFESANTKSDELFTSIKDRYTSRKMFGSEYLSPDILTDLKKWTRRQKLKTRHLSSFADKTFIGQLAIQAEEYWSLKKQFSQELISFLESDISGSLQKNPQFEKHIKIDRNVIDKNLVLSQNASEIIILYTDKNDFRSWVKLGMDLEKLLLYLASKKIGVAYFNLITSIKTLAKTISQKYNISYPQLVLRLGVSLESHPRLSRLPVDKLLV